MNLNKRICSFLLAVFFIFSLIFFSGCTNQTLTVPKYPLDITTVESALQEAGLSWTVEEQEPVVEGQTIYNLRKDDELIGNVISGLKDGETFLNVSAALYYNNEYSLPKSEWENFIVFATILNGGFKNKHQLYNVFSKEYDTVNTTKFPSERTSGDRFGFEERSSWENKINDYYIQIDLVKPYINSSEEYLSIILISTNLDTFLPNNQDHSIPSDEMSLEYLETLLYIDLATIDTGGFGEDEFEKKVTVMYKYLYDNYKQYFTKEGYASFLNNEIYRARLKFFKENNIVSIKNMDIDLKLAKKEDDAIAYDYTITYTAETEDSRSFEFSDKGQLLLRKTADNDFKIEEDYIRYYDIKFISP
ncbi:hypothetical protein [Proteocatella sphenisci]|uniref:hypothetical protein n=1 Tax=Proteocatella sphenisci TaxID=181070 RepID=UPI00048ED282|nr:hypothetical protein [Proteocatella sphenisci]